MSVVSPLANVDWPTVAAAIGTLIGSLWLTIKGLQRGRAKVESGQSSITSIVGGTIMDNQSIRAFTDQMKHNNQCLHEMTEELRRNTAAITRQTDLDLVQHRKLDYRDDRDHR